MSSQLQVLMIDDSHTDGLLIEKHLLKQWEALVFKRVESAKEMREALKNKHWDIILSDQLMLNFNATEALQVLKDSKQDIPFIVVSGAVDMDFFITMGLLQSGVDDFVKKGDTARLIPSINRVMGEVNLRREKQKAIEEHEKIERNLQDLYENAPVAYFSVGVDGIISKCNKQAGVLIGCSSEHLVGHSILDLYANTPNGRILAEKMLVKLINGLEVHNQELQMKKMDGTTVWISLTLNIVYDDQGNVLESRSIVVDKSDQKLLEEQLIQSQKMTALGVMAGGIAHDFNNMLGIIIGYANLLMSDIEGEKNHNYITQILNASNRSTDLVKQILGFSRLNTSKLEPINLSKEVENSLKFISGTTPASINIKKSIPNAPFNILAEKIQINQIIMNLMSNAIYAMNETGEITVTLKKLDVKEYSQLRKELPRYESYVQLTIKDTGSGILKKDLDHIFDPFFTTKDIGKGTGLGLPIVYKIIENHNGNIIIKSDIDIGTSVEICFPLIEKDVININTIESADLAPSLFSGGSGHILLVEDEKDLANVYSDFLRSSGYQVSLCNTGMDALALFKKMPETYDLVITDLSMPEMTGKQLSIELLKIKPNIPIIINTGYADTVTYKMSKNIGIKKIMFKPINFIELISAIEEYIFKN